VRAVENAPYTYFILLTALGDSEHRIAGMQAGADDYLSKPFSIADLQARLIAAERVTALHRRREALLRQARRVAAENDPKRLLDDLLQEATKLVDGAAGLVTRWDAVQRRLVPVGSTTAHLGQTTIRLGEGASGRAAQQRSAVLLGRSECGGLEPELATGDVEAAAAVPLIHEGELIGTLAVAARPGLTFSRQDLETLELLASTTAGALVALERARLEGVLLAARTAQHELNNQLAIARGYAELLVAAPDLPPQLFEVAQEVMRAADDAARIIKQLRTVARIRETRWPEPSETTINLSASARPLGRRGRLHQAAGHR
jgi:CheY-like chemotaxis protein